ncbi:hypothetical protein Tco_1313893 [Tanacetum coccineum]
MLPRPVSNCNNLNFQTRSSLVVPVVPEEDGRQTTYAAGTTRKYTPGASGQQNMGKQTTVICYIAKREGHIASSVLSPKVEKG